MDKFLIEAERLYQLGFAVHWIKKNSKAPVKSGWNGPTRDSWRTVKSEYRKGYGLGVRLGEPSGLAGGGFLANIDVDLKSNEDGHQSEVIAAVEARFPEVRQAPCVQTGFGWRYFVRTREPMRSGKIGASPDEVLVLMPSAEINRRQKEAVRRGIMTEEDLRAGLRLRGAWEIEFMSGGKQVLLPPTLHPDTGEPYAWTKGIDVVSDIPFINVKGLSELKGMGRAPGAKAIANFEPETVDLNICGLPQSTVDLIVTGEGVVDRSAAMFGATITMLRAGFSDLEILSVLTNRRYALGEVAYEHRNTASRAAAAAWVRDYCLAKAKREADAANVFAAEVVVDAEPLDDTESALQSSDLLQTEWQEFLLKTDKGQVRPTVRNVMLILRHDVCMDVIRRDTFAYRDSYGCDTPWVGGRKGKAITDSDFISIKLWLAKVWGVEPSTSTIMDAVNGIAARNEHHPVRDELEALPKWDGKERLDTWLKRYFKAEGDDEYLAQVLRKWMLASVTRTYEPGHKFDWMPILQGPQGCGKSAFGAILFGQKYFNDWLPNLSDKDAAVGLQGIRCHEFSELAGLRKSELDATKAFITRQIDKVRPAYGRTILELARQCVFFGTTNLEWYLKDETGNRRYAPVRVGRLNFDQLFQDREQLWAEAMLLYEIGEERSLYLEGSAQKWAKRYQTESAVPTEDVSDFMILTLGKFVRVNRDKFNFNSFKLAELFTEFGPLMEYKADTGNLMAAAKAVQRFGGRKRHTEKGSVWSLPTNHIL